ncbi:DUF1439 domain-containing protein [Photobacterium angustum]|uniref:DUF1439 domain-containing protein n=1 Tax=Photobacterium angustum TaxID=661 RepID=UPI0005E1ECE7|nr:DUF1439 domain-containing protein [Photobacterium angustum]KJG02910.1 hypothetical protein UB35_04200 [Photobacterium angustum]PSV62743.1 DUF1439 domain-containing protein [Photobacterium angustum]
MRLKALIIVSSAFFFAGCSSYGVTESEMQNYINKETNVERSVGIQGIAYATGKFEKVKVGIGRVADNRVSVDTTASAQLELAGQPPQDIVVKANFSAIPYYNQDEGAIYLRGLNIESLAIKPEKFNNMLTKPVITPFVSLIGQVLSTKPVYKLDENELKQALLKSTKPELVIKNHQLVLDW